MRRSIKRKRTSTPRSNKRARPAARGAQKNRSKAYRARRTRGRFSRRRRFGYKRRNTLGLKLARRFYTDGKLKRGKLALSLFKQFGDMHRMQYYWKWHSSDGTYGRQNTVFRIGPPCVDTTNWRYNWLVPPLATTNVGDHGYNFFAPAAGRYPQTDKYLLHSIKIRLFIEQLNEDGRVRIVIFKPKANKYPTQTATFAEFTWPPNFNDTNNLHEAINTAAYRVYFDKTIKYEFYGQSGNVYNRTRSFDFYLPINRMYRTVQGNDAATFADWIDTDVSNWGKYLQMAIMTNDNTNADGQTWKFSLYCTWTFSTQF